MSRVRRRRIAWTLAVAIVAACAAWIALRGGGAERPQDARSRWIAAAANPSAGPAGGPAVPSRAGSAAREPDARNAFDVVVRDPSGAPVGGARVAADALLPPNDRWESDRWMPDGSDSAPVVTATTDRAGRASVPAAGDGRWRITAEAAGFVRCAVESARCEGDPVREVVVTLERAYALDVLVRDAAGNPAPRVAVRVSDFDREPWPREWIATTSAAGTCRLDALPRGTLAVRCEAAERGESVFVEVPGVARVELGAPPTAEEIARQTATLELRVVDPAGAAIAGASVVFESGGGHETAHGTSGEDGVCTAIAVADALACVERIVVRREGCATERRSHPLVQVGAGERHRFEDVILRAEARLEGRVAGPEGGVAGARVTVWVRGFDRSGAMVPEETTADADGAYRVAGLPPGTAVVEAHAPGLDPVDADAAGNVAGPGGPRWDERDRVAESARAVLLAGRTVVHDVQMKRTGRAQPLRVTFTGRVIRSDGTPVPWADVWTTGYSEHWYVRNAGSALSAADGSFCVTAQADEGFSLYATAFGLWTEAGVSVEVEESGTRSGIELVVVPRPMVRGVVRSSLGLPVAGGRVRVGAHHVHKFNHATHWDDEPDGVVGADGRYAVPVVVGPFGGDYHDMRLDELVVLVEVEGHGPAISTPFTPADLAARRSFDFALDAGAEISGRVTDATGSPVADAPISLVTDGGWNTDDWPPRHPPRYAEVLAARTGPDGAFAIRRLFAGRYRVTTRVDGCVPETVAVTAPASDVAMRVRASHSVAGVLLEPGDAATPVRGADLRLESVAGGDFEARGATAEDGTFRFDRVPAGTWRLVVVPDAEGPDVQPMVVDVVAGATDLRIRTRPGLSIAGTLCDAAGRPVVGTEIRIDREDGGPHAYAHCVTDRAGQFVFRRLAPGRHGLHFPALDLSLEGIEAPGAPALRVPGELTITGRLEVRSGDHAPHVSVRARRVDAPPGTPIDVHDADVKDGVFTVSGLAAGRYEIAVEGSVQEPRRSWEWRMAERTVLPAGTTGAVLPVDLVEVTRGRDDR